MSDADAAIGMCNRYLRLTYALYYDHGRHTHKSLVISFFAGWMECLRYTDGMCRMDGSFADLMNELSGPNWFPDERFV